MTANTSFADALCNIQAITSGPNSERFVIAVEVFLPGTEAPIFEALNIANPLKSRNALK